MAKEAADTPAVQTQLPANSTQAPGRLVLDPNSDEYLDLRATKTAGDAGRKPLLTREQARQYRDALMKTDQELIDQEFELQKKRAELESLREQIKGLDGQIASRQVAPALNQTHLLYGVAGVLGLGALIWLFTRRKAVSSAEAAASAVSESQVPNWAVSKSASEDAIDAQHELDAIQPDSESIDLAPEGESELSESVADDASPLETFSDGVEELLDVDSAEEASSDAPNWDSTEESGSDDLEEMLDVDDFTSLPPVSESVEPPAVQSLVGDLPVAEEQVEAVVAENLDQPATQSDISEAVTPSEAAAIMEARSSRVEELLKALSASETDEDEDATDEMESATVDTAQNNSSIAANFIDTDIEPREGFDALDSGLEVTENAIEEQEFISASDDVLLDTGYRDDFSQSDFGASSAQAVEKGNTSAGVDFDLGGDVTESQAAAVDIGGSFFTSSFEKSEGSTAQATAVITDPDAFAQWSGEHAADAITSYEELVELDGDSNPFPFERLDEEAESFEKTASEIDFDIDAQAPEATAESQDAEENTVFVAGSGKRRPWYKRIFGKKKNKAAISGVAWDASDVTDEKFGDVDDRLADIWKDSNDWLPDVETNASVEQKHIDLLVEGDSLQSIDARPSMGQSQVDFLRQLYMHVAHAKQVNNIDHARTLLMNHVFAMPDTSAWVYLEYLSLADSGSEEAHLVTTYFKDRFNRLPPSTDALGLGAQLRSLDDYHNEVEALSQHWPHGESSALLDQWLTGYTGNLQLFSLTAYRDMFLLYKVLDSANMSMSDYTASGGPDIEL